MSLWIKAPSPAVPLAPGPEEPCAGGAGLGHRCPGAGEGAGAGERGVSEPARQRQTAATPGPWQQRLSGAQQHPAALRQEKVRSRSECCPGHTRVKYVLVLDLNTFLRFTDLVWYNGTSQTANTVFWSSCLAHLHQARSIAHKSI